MARADEIADVLKLLKSAPFDAAQPVPVARGFLDGLGDAFAPPDGLTIEATRLGGRPAERIVADPAGPVVLYLHGGGYVIGSLKSHRHLAGLLAREVGGSVVLLDYRLAPEDPFPAALDDALAAWRELAGRERPERCAIAGDSAGGGLAFATVVAARDAGLPLPGALVGISPWVNLGAENPSYDRLAAVDPLLSREVCAYFAPRYAGTTQVRDPRISPLFARLEGLPPTLIQIGDREVFFGDATDMHEKLVAAGTDATLAVWKEMFHVWHLYWPMLEDGRAAIAEIGRFVSRVCAS